MINFINQFWGWLIGLVVMGMLLLVVNAFLWLWHRLTKGRRQILSFVLICHADDAPSWKGNGKANAGANLKVDDFIAMIFADSKTVSVADLVKDCQASRKSCMLLIPAGNRIESESEAIGVAAESSRASLSPSELSKSKAMVIQSATSGNRSYVVLIGNFPGKAPKLIFGD